MRGNQIDALARLLAGFEPDALNPQGYKARI